MMKWISGGCVYAGSIYPLFFLGATLHFFERFCSKLFTSFDKYIYRILIEI